MKRCPGCNKTKGTSEFYRDRHSHDELFWRCKTCQNHYMRERKRGGGRGRGDLVTETPGRRPGETATHPCPYPHCGAPLRVPPSIRVGGVAECICRMCVVRRTSDGLDLVRVGRLAESDLVGEIEAHRVDES